MRVLYPLRYFPTLTETFVYREIDGLLDHGVEIVIAALGRRDDGRIQDELPRAPVLRVPRRPWTGRLHPTTAGERWLRQHQRPKDAARLPWLAAQTAGCDRVHAHFAGEAAEFAYALHLDQGLPYSVTVHAVDLFRPRRSFTEVLQHADQIITVCEHHQAVLAQRGLAAQVVRCGPVLRRWALPPPPSGPLQAIFVGRDVPKKGLDTLLDAWTMGRIPGALRVFSDRTGTAPPGVTLCGLQPPGVIRAAMAWSNAVVLPCRRSEDGDQDGVPLALMEGMAAGRPVITTPVSGIPELVDEAVGWLVRPDDPQALITALRAAQDPVERGLRGGCGPDRLQKRGFTRQEQVRGVLALWQDQHGTGTGSCSR